MIALDEIGRPTQYTVASDGSSIAVASRRGENWVMLPGVMELDTKARLRTSRERQGYSGKFPPVVVSTGLGPPSVITGLGW